MPKPLSRNKRIKFPIQEINKDPLQHIKKTKKKKRTMKPNSKTPSLMTHGIGDLDSMSNPF